MTEVALRYPNKATMQMTCGEAAHVQTSYPEKSLNAAVLNVLTHARLTLKKRIWMFAFYV
eukprot:scaffold144081_cov24-Prasinocladus_malaysianus.AAC.2